MASIRKRLFRICGHSRRYFSYGSRLSIAANNEFLQISEDVREALHANRPVVALETTIYTHGFPYPENVALALELESIIRVNGGVPATIGILEGVAKIGFDPKDLIRLVSTAGNAETLKLSRRDLSYACGMRLAGKSFNGGTTIAGTCILAHLAGIGVFATGGLGGVHRGAESSMDISADLTELGRTPVAVVSSGCKSFLDIPRTLEYLETEGVTVATFADGRDGKVDFPAFWTRDSGVRSPLTIQNEFEAAALIYAQNKLQLSSGIHFANPIPAEAAIPKAENDVFVEEAIRQADAANASGKDNTPFILSKIKELSGGKSVHANRVLIASNVKRGTLIAKELTKLEAERRDNIGDIQTLSWQAPQLPPSSVNTNADHTDAPTPLKASSTADIIVVGALAVDYSCNYTPLNQSALQVSPVLQTSNPATISQTLGGVAHNIALAAHLVGAKAKLCSLVGEDLAGSTALPQLEAEGMDASYIQTLKSERTSQYVAVNDAKKDLVIAMADMGILERHAESLSLSVADTIQEQRPKWLISDANLDSKTLLKVLQEGKKIGARTAFEPVSVAKAIRILDFPRPANGLDSVDKGRLPIFPNHLIDLATPNQLELAAIHTTARQSGYFESQGWWEIIDALGIPASEARSRLVAATTADIVNQGIPQQSIQLLPFIPCIITKLGPNGALLTMLLDKDDSRLSDGNVAPYIISRSHSIQHAHPVGGVYMRLFPPAEALQDSEILSVNGVGDTFLGALIASAVKTERGIDELVDFAQKAAVLTLRSQEAVSPALPSLKGLLDSP